MVADDGSVSLISGDDVIATAVPGAVQAQAPPAPTVEEAEIATRRYVGFTRHRFPTCFVCGTSTRDDGLRIYAGQADSLIEELHVPLEHHIARHPARHPADMDAVYTWEWLIARSGEEKCVPISSGGAPFRASCLPPGRCVLER